MWVISNVCGLGIDFLSGFFGFGLYFSLGRERIVIYGVFMES